MRSRSGLRVHLREARARAWQPVGGLCSVGRPLRSPPWRSAGLSSPLAPAEKPAWTPRPGLD